MTATSELRYDVDGVETTAWLSKPDGPGPWPAVLVVHDGIGLECYQRSRAVELADAGYVALAMDYHGGRTFFGDPDAMLARVMPLLADRDRMYTLGRRALDTLLGVSGVDTAQVGAVGFGAGGSIVLELLRNDVQIAAAAVVHPAVPDSAVDDWIGTRCSLLLATGSADPISPPERLLALGAVLQSAGVDWRLDVYGGALHAFWAESDGRPTVPGVGHHPAHARRLWRDVLDHVGSVLG